MGFSRNESLYYIAKNGDIHQAVTLSDERHGSVDIAIDGNDAPLTGISCMDLCRTVRAASILANRRRPT